MDDYNICPQVNHFLNLAIATEEIFMLNSQFTKENMFSFINQLKKIMDSKTPINPHHQKGHEEKVKNAKRFYDELKNVTTFWPDGFPVYRVHKEQLRKLLSKGKFSIQDKDSHFALYMSEDESSSRYYLLYLHPITRLKEEDFWDI